MPHNEDELRYTTMTLFYLYKSDTYAYGNVKRQHYYNTSNSSNNNKIYDNILRVSKLQKKLANLLTENI